MDRQDRVDVFLRGQRGELTRLTSPPEDWQESWKDKQAFQRGEAAAYHFCRENDRYDMMCWEEGSTALR